MKKLVLFITVCMALSTLSGCFIFRKKEKYGCPATARNTGAESAENMGKQKKKDRYKGGNKFF